MELASHIDAIRPSGRHASSWDRLLEALWEEPLSQTVVRLHAERADLVRDLCTLLDGVEPPHAFDNLDRQDKRIVTGLLMLGAVEGLRYLLSHIDLLLWRETESLTQLMQPHREAFSQAASEVWESLKWGDRASLVLVFADHDLPCTALVERLLAIDGETLSYQDRTEYVQALGYTEDAEATARIHLHLNRALEDPGQLDDDGKQFVTETVYHLGPEALTPDQRQRAANCGLDICVLADPEEAIH